MIGWRPGLFGRDRDRIRAQELEKIRQQLSKRQRLLRTGKGSLEDEQRVEDLLARRVELKREAAES